MSVPYLNCAATAECRLWRLTLTFAAVVSGLSATPCRGAETTEVLTPVVVRGWVDLMASNNPALRAAQAQARAAHLNADGVRRLADPNLILGGSLFGAKGDTPSTQGNLIYGIEQPLPLLGKEAAAKSVALANAEVEAARSDARFQELRRNLAVALFQAALARRETVLADADARWLEDMTHSLEARLGSGQSSPVEVLRAQTEHARRRVEVENLRNREAETRAAVNRLLGRNPDATLPDFDLPTLAGPVAYSEQLVRLAQAAEPRLRVLDRERVAARAAVDATRKSRRPDLSLGVEGRQYGGDGDFREGTFLLNVSLPLWNRSKYRKDLDRDRERLRVAEEEHSDSTVGLREELHHITLRLSAARREALLNEDEILPRAEATFQAALAQWSGGKGDLRDVLDSRRLILESRIQLARAIANQWAALSELVLCCGLGDLEAIDMLRAPEPAPSKP